MRKLSDWIDNFLLLTDNTEPPISYRRWTAICTIAACLKRKTWTNWGFKNTYPNLYVVLVGPPGACRKGTAMDVGKMFLTDLGVKIAAECTSIQSLIKSLRKSIEHTMSKENNITPTTHCSLTVFSKELTVFLGYNNPEFLSTLTDWFDCEDEWTYSTVGRGDEIINGVWVNLIGATTPGLIQSSLPRDAIGGGLTSRIIFIYEDKKYKVVSAPFLSPEERELRKVLIHDLTEILMLSGEFKMTKEFFSLYDDFYINQETEGTQRDPMLANYYERRILHLRKLSMILSASRSNDMILEAQDFHRAVRFLTEAERRMGETFRGVGRNEDAELMGRIRTSIALKGEMRYSEILARYSNDADDMRMKNIVATMIAAKFADIVQDGNSDPIIRYRKSEG